MVLKRLEMSSLWQLQMILPDRAYAFFSHTHKAQKENMPLLDKVLNISLYHHLFSQPPLSLLYKIKMLTNVLRSLRKECPCLIMS